MFQFLSGGGVFKCFFKNFKGFFGVFGGTVVFSGVCFVSFCPSTPVNTTATPLKMGFCENFLFFVFEFLSGGGVFKWVF